MKNNNDELAAIKSEWMVYENNKRCVQYGKAKTD